MAMHGKTFKLNVETRDGKKIILCADWHVTTIDELKNMIHDEVGIPQQKQRLVFAGEYLDNGRKNIGDYNMQWDSTLFLVDPRRVMPISVKTLTGKNITLGVDSRDKILSIKTRIFELEGTPVHQQRLIIEGKQAEDNRTLADYNINEGSVFHLILRIRPERFDFTVKILEGKKFTVRGCDCCPIRFLKHQIEEKAEIQPDEYRLFYAGKQLDMSKSLLKYNFKEGSVIDLVPHVGHDQ